MVGRRDGNVRDGRYQGEGVIRSVLHFGPVETLPHQDAFDIAVLWDVIEHCPHPDSVLEAVSARLKPGAAVLLTTANYESLDRLHGGWSWWGWEADHYHYFRPAGLERLGRRVGLGNFVLQRVPRIKAPMGDPSELDVPRKKRFRHLNPVHLARALRANAENLYARFQWPYYDVGVMLCAMEKT